MRKEIEETKENNLKKLKNSLPKVIKGKNMMFVDEEVEEQCCAHTLERIKIVERMLERNNMTEYNPLEVLKVMDMNSIIAELSSLEETMNSIKDAIIISR